MHDHAKPPVNFHPRSTHVRAKRGGTLIGDLGYAAALVKRSTVPCQHRLGRFFQFGGNRLYICAGYVDYSITIASQRDGHPGVLGTFPTPQKGVQTAVRRWLADTGGKG
jgi:hypothetical protein